VRVSHIEYSRHGEFCGGIALDEVTKMLIADNAPDRAAVPN
jgi:hypothetical protein